jgi:hypothetical protein
MGWNVELNDEFKDWFEGLDDDEQESVAYAVDLLAERGPHLQFPHSSSIERSRHGHMRELRIQHKGRPYRALYAFDPRRTAILLLGGDKTGDDRWYEEQVPKADAIYERYIEQIKAEGLIRDD